MDTGMTCIVKDQTDAGADDCSLEVSGSSERFHSVLDKMRLKRKAEEAEFEQNPFVKSETVTIPVEILISKLKNRFSEEKQTRMQTAKSSYSQLHFSNSVDAFLRHHEKPKVDIQYSEGDEVLPGEGLYSFAVRPSKIRKQRKDTLEARKNVHGITISPGEHTVRLEDAGYCSNGASPKKQNDVYKKKLSSAFESKALDEIIGFTIPLNSSRNIPTAVKVHVVSPSGNIAISETVMDCIVPRTNKMLAFEHLIPATTAIATASSPYVCLYKDKSYKGVYSYVIALMLGRHISETFCDYIAPLLQRCNYFREILFLMAHCWYTELCNYTVQKVNGLPLSIYGHTVPPISQVHVPKDTQLICTNRKLSNRAISLLNKIKDCITMYKYGYKVQVAHKILDSEAIYFHSDPRVFGMIIPEELYCNMIHVTCSVFLLPESLSLHHTPRYRPSTEERYTCVASSSHNIRAVRQIQSHADRRLYGAQVYASISPSLMAAILADMYHHGIKTIFSTHAPKEICEHSTTRISTSVLGEDDDHVMQPVKDISTLEHLHNNALQAEGKESEVDQVQHSTLETTGPGDANDDDALLEITGPRDAYEDESLFGILSVYCNR